nr:SAM-dependent methyltransferase [Allosaccharopolyspora coralli]
MAPTERDYCQANRSFLGGAVQHLVTEDGNDQFLDLGSGVPTVGNVHEIAHRHNPVARVAHVDWEVIACHHARNLLGDNEHLTIIEADVTQVDVVLDAAARLLTYADRPPAGSHLVAGDDSVDVV